jgi:hypothetical protein
MVMVAWNILRGASVASTARVSTMENPEVLMVLNGAGPLCENADAIPKTATSDAESNLRIGTPEKN